MCYADRSLEQATSTCAMCKVFPPRNNYPCVYIAKPPPSPAMSSTPRARRCPHKGSMGVCKNRANHPRHDVVHFRNAELSSFNGCGFCKVCLASSSLRSPLSLGTPVGQTSSKDAGCRRGLEEPRLARLLSPTKAQRVRLHQRRRLVCH